MPNIPPDPTLIQLQETVLYIKELIEKFDKSKKAMDTYLTSKQVPTIQNWDLPCFQIATVDRFGYKRKYFLVDGWDPELV